MEFQFKEPYPKPQVIGPNEEYAELLLASYAGGISELSAIHLYIYQSFILEKEDKKILHSISIVEMHHLELLAETIRLLGKDPKFYTLSTSHTELPWTADYISYPSSFKEMLEVDLESERQAIMNYRATIDQIKDPYIQALLLRIIKDEELHIQIFEGLKKKNNLAP